MKKTNIGLLGFGVIGKGVKDLIEINSDKYNIHLVKILDKPENKDIVGSLYVSNYKDITEDESIDIVVEAMGGNDFAYTCIKDALLNKKSVVTSNKEVISRNLKEFKELAKKNNVNILFEASVGGGIPIIHPLLENTKFNNINRIDGIINGTTNYIVSNMEDGLDFNSSLKKAQENGFAEADPTADLEGLDMVRKIAILSDIAYDTFIDLNDITHFGINNLSSDIIDYANKLNKKIKFMASSIKNDDEVKLYVMPRLVDKNNEASNVRYENNIVSIHANYNDKLSFIGKGAGRYPTASAMISDIIKIIEKTYVNKLTYDKVYKVNTDVFMKNRKYLIKINNIISVKNGEELESINLNDIQFIALVEE